MTMMLRMAGTLGQRLEVDPALVGWWKFDGDLTDASGNGNNGTVGAGIAAYAEGVYGQAFDFDGSNAVDTGSETIGDGLFADADRRWTVSVWAAVPAGINRGTIVARGASDLDERTFQIYHQDGQDGERSPGVFIRGARTVTSLGLNNGQWYFYTVSWDGSTARLFVDGVFVMNLSVGSADENSGERVIIGARTNGTAFRLTGLVDNLMIYNRALTPSEIKYVYDTGRPIPKGATVNA